MYHETSSFKIIQIKFLVIFLLLPAGLAFGQIGMNSSGNVGIGSSPSSQYRLNTSSANFTGNVGFNLGYAGMEIKLYSQAAILHPRLNNTSQLGLSNKAFKHVYAYNVHELSSGLTEKENIRDLDNALDIVNNLKGIRFDYKKSVFHHDDEKLQDTPGLAEKIEKERKNKIGFIAQEMQEVLPEAVHYDDSTGVYSITYTRLIPVLVNAIQEQQAMIEELKTFIKNNQTKSAPLAKNMERATTNNPELFQNNPNPFTESTEIEYYLPESVSTASLYIYDMKGKQLRNMPLNQTGQGAVTIQGGELDAGIYLYTLMADGTAVNTKQMILTD